MKHTEEPPIIDTISALFAFSHLMNKKCRPQRRTTTTTRQIYDAKREKIITLTTTTTTYTEEQ